MSKAKQLIKKVVPQIIIRYIRRNQRRIELGRINDLNAKTFQDKIKLRIKKSAIPAIGKKMSLYADKYKVRAYVAGKIGENNLINLISVSDTLTKEIWDELPSKFVIKTNFGTGSNHYHIVTNKNKESFSIIKEKFDKALSDDWYLSSHEMAYSFIDRKIVIEEYMSGLNGLTSPDDYKIHCFKNMDGSFECITQIDRGRFEGIHRNFYSHDLELLDMNYGGASNFNFEIVEHSMIIKEMQQLAINLLGELTYARVDFYYVKNKILFGEITHTHTAGNASFTPREQNLIMGNKIKTNSVFM